MSLLISALAAVLNWGATVVLALSENAELALITGIFGFLSSLSAAVFGYLAHTRGQRVETRVDEAAKRLVQVEQKVEAPRPISTTREAGPRVEGPDLSEGT